MPCQGRGGDVVAEERICTMSIKGKPRSRWYGTPFESRYEVQKDGCWNWLPALNNSGYGCFKLTSSHRASYEIHIGPIPDGLDIDHLCRNRKCVNSDHLEVVTRRENLVRGNTIIARNVRQTHCTKGHPYSGKNLSIHRDGSRRCRVCNAEKSRQWRDKKRHAA